LFDTAAFRPPLSLSAVFRPAMPTDPILTGLPPIIDEHSRVLVLGSFPSPASLAAQQYYGHKQNQFWPIIAALTGEALVGAAYADKQRALLAHGIGVWDVYRHCAREGALDSAIRQAEANDFSQLQQWAPGLQQVCFNGQTAGRFLRLFEAAGYRTCVLPSTSPAYTLPLAEKLARWRAALTPPSNQGDPR
jgi:hypoxanthine-DNA glycosylase